MMILRTCVQVLKTWKVCGGCEGTYTFCKRYSTLYFLRQVDKRRGRETVSPLQLETKGHPLTPKISSIKNLLCDFHIEKKLLTMSNIEFRKNRKCSEVKPPALFKTFVFSRSALMKSFKFPLARNFQFMNSDLFSL